MYYNLKAEMARKSLITKDIAETLGVAERTARNKITGVTPWTMSEAIKLRNSIFPELDLEYLFEEGKLS